MHRILSKFANLNYFSARRYYKHRLHKLRRKYSKSPILIYQMGKVGSSSIKRSLEALEIDRPIYHVHFLSEQRIKQTEQERKKFFGTNNASYRRPWLYQYLRDQYTSQQFRDKWKIITLTRDPIARNISTFYENIEFEPMDAAGTYQIKSDYYHIDPMIVRQDNLMELQKLFFKRLDHDVPLKFFDRELKHVFNIDVFGVPFPKKLGFMIYCGRKVDILLIRLESLNSCAARAFKEFLNIDDFTLLGDNIGGEKIYAPIYAKFKKDVILPASYVDKMYCSQYAEHFYSPEEIAGFRKKWFPTAQQHSDS